ncbi:MAG: hypothetical protein RL648_1648 [Verrucomicrobiota bacterium]
MKASFVLFSLVVVAPLVAQETDLPQAGRLIYQNNLGSPEDVDDWVMEGPGELAFKDGWMEVYSPDEAFHHVLWCSRDLPEAFVAEWQVQNRNPDGGLCIVFFAAHGDGGEDIFDPSLPERDGDFRWYIKDRLNSYHISYYANTPKKPDRGRANLRKNNTFRLVQEGAEGIPASSADIHTVKLVKEKARIRFYIDDRKIIDWTDTGETDGRPAYGGGKFGFRQMQWTRFRYRNLVVRELLPQPELMKAMTSLPVVHPKQRMWASPANGETVWRNPPSLRWVPVAGKGRTYDIRLSRDPAFPEERSYVVAHLPWAVHTPSRVLEPGSWYWQVRESGKEWSPAYQFVVSADSAAWNPPSAAEVVAAVPLHRPRLLVDGPDWPAFQQRAVGTEEKRAILEAAEPVFSRQIPSEKNDILKIVGETPQKTDKLRKDASKEIGTTLYAGVLPLCRAYVLTGDRRYAMEAIKWAMEGASWDPDGVTQINDFGDGRIMLAMATVYDTLQEHLTPAQSRQLVEATAARAENFFKSYVNAREAVVLSNHVWQHILHYFFDTAIALHGAHPEAGKWLSYLYELFIARAPVLGGQDGGWVHGLAYFRMNFETLIDIPFRLRDYTGFDFFKHTPWYAENVNYFLYGFRPGSAGNGFADNAHDLPEPRGDYLAYADALSRITGNPYAAWYRDEIMRVTSDLTPHYQDYWRADYIEESTGPVRLEETAMLRWARLRYLNFIPAPEPVSPEALPMARAFKGVGLVNMHSHSLDKPVRDNLFVAMRASPFGAYSHMLADQNTFNMVYGGDRLFYHTGYKVAMSAPHRQLYYKHTQSHNGILINGEGQPYTTDAYAWIENFLTGEHLSYALGNASNAYSSVEEDTDSGLRSFRRHVLMLRPDIVVIYDELTAEEEAVWTYALHSYKELRIEPQKGQIDGGNAFGMARVHLRSSATTEWSVTDKYPVEADNWRGVEDADGNLVEYTHNAWHFAAHSVPVPAIRFLAIYQVLPKEGAAPFPFNEFLEGEDGSIAIGPWTVKAEMDPSKAARILVSNTVSGVYFSSSGGLTTPAGEQVATPGMGTATLLEAHKGTWQLRQSSPDIPPGAMEALLNLGIF